MRLTGLLATALLALCVATAASAQEEEGVPSDRPAFTYVPMTPPYVVTLAGTERISYLKAEVSLRVREDALSLVELHMPALRHELIMLFSAKTPDELEGAATRELLRQQALTLLRSVLTPDGQADAIKDLLFTNFIVQR